MTISKIQYTSETINNNFYNESVFLSHVNLQDTKQKNPIFQSPQPPAPNFKMIEVANKSINGKQADVFVIHNLQLGDNTTAQDAYVSLNEKGDVIVQYWSPITNAFETAKSTDYNAKADRWNGGMKVDAFAADVPVNGQYNGKNDKLLFSYDTQEADPKSKKVFLRIAIDPNSIDFKKPHINTGEGSFAQINPVDMSSDKQQDLVWYDASNKAIENAIYAKEKTGTGQDSGFWLELSFNKGAAVKIFDSNYDQPDE